LLGRIDVPIKNSKIIRPAATFGVRMFFISADLQLFLAIFFFWLLQVACLFVGTMKRMRLRMSPIYIVNYQQFAFGFFLLLIKPVERGWDFELLTAPVMENQLWNFPGYREGRGSRGIWIGGRPQFNVATRFENE